MGQQRLADGQGGGEAQHRPLHRGLRPTFPIWPRISAACYTGGVRWRRNSSAVLRTGACWLILIGLFTDLTVLTRSRGSDSFPLQEIRRHGRAESSVTCRACTGGVL
jgi:hypothetical protein